MTELRNGTLVQRRAAAPVPGTTTLRLTRQALVSLVTQTVDLARALADGTVEIDGDPDDLGRLMTVLVPGDPSFPIVTPRS